MLTSTFTGGVGSGAGLNASASSIAYTLPGVAAQGGAIINRLTTILAGENPAVNPEVILNRPQMQVLFASQMRQANTEVGISIIQVNSRAQAEQEAAHERGLGREVIISEVLSEMAKGEGSKIIRTIRSVQR